MRHVVFDTPGKIDIRAFTIFGASAKPNTDSPIGFFGTGLKYAVAALARHDLEMKVITPENTMVFYKQDDQFRNTEITSIRMRRDKGLFRGPGVLLPFTTQLGRTWELWQVFRELESNTRDENGQTYLVDDDADILHEALVVESLEPKLGRTLIVVSGEPFVSEFLDRDKTFLPGGLRKRDDSTGEVQVFERKSEFIYWRGMRVYKLEKPSELTYNVLTPVDLTEDRTLKYSTLVEGDIKRWLVSKAPAETIQAALKNTSSWEGRTSWDYMYQAPSKVFAETAAKSENAGVKRYLKGYEPKVPDILAKLGPFTVQCNAEESYIMDGEGRNLSDEQYKRVCDILNTHFPAPGKTVERKTADEEILF